MYKSQVMKGQWSLGNDARVVSATVLLSSALREALAPVPPRFSRRANLLTGTTHKWSTYL